MTYSRHARRILALGLASVALIIILATAVTGAIASTISSALGIISASASAAWLWRIVSPPAINPTEPVATAYQRMRLIAASMYQARQDARHNPQAEHDVKWCPST